MNNKFLFVALLTITCGSFVSPTQCNEENENPSKPKFERDFRVDSRENFNEWLQKARKNFEKYKNSERTCNHLLTSFDIYEELFKELPKNEEDYKQLMEILIDKEKSTMELCISEKKTTQGCEELKKILRERALFELASSVQDLDKFLMIKQETEPENTQLLSRIIDSRDRVAFTLNNLSEYFAKN